MGDNMRKLKVSETGRYLAHEDGSPFFWLGDTAWELFHKLNREDAKHYLSCRAEQGFNVVQAVALAELVGLTTGNAYGRMPLFRDAAGTYDPSQPDVSGEYSYWDHVDYILETAKAMGLYVAMLPTWGDKFNARHGKGPEIFTPSNAYAYGKWLGARYRDAPHLIWVLGGDRGLQTRKHFEVIVGMARGLKEGDGGCHLMTFHPKGSSSSSYHAHGEEWLDFNMIQSGHGELEPANYKMVAADYGLVPAKPVLDGEPCYEDIPRAFNPRNGYFDEADVRRAAYYAVFSGACGHTYGHHSVWAMSDGMYDSVELKEPGPFFIMHWKDALRRPGAGQMRHLKELWTRFRMEDGEPDQELLAANFEGSNYRAALRGRSASMIYCPNGLYVDVRMDRVGGGQVRAAWFNPRDGRFSDEGSFPGEGERRFACPSSGRGNDWVLVLTILT
ncbi:glycoside hydrolase family 140 protein [Paenibacillus soyae]|uniref:Glycoside hydrolase family 140 protein n=1 Tax=Paenibacillus soyae TaxID=2969249 RepID=A0A9X2S979_9BACL|nr:glycoside hydrolase family 140 protein [Paenibacillus soyae]MCR2804860.1 glycoside hydrolase family 140 protein [Paenibacillus soyae]